jgi:hypothetical protein
MTGKPPPQGGIDGPPPLPPWEAEAQARQEAAEERQRLYQKRIAENRRMHAARIEADNREQAELLAAIIEGDVSPHEINPRTLVGERAKDTLLVAKRLWDVCFQFRLDSLAHEALEFLGDTMRDTGAEIKVRVDAAKTIVGARLKMAAKVNNPGEAAVRSLLLGMNAGGGAQSLKDLGDGELLEGFKRLLIAATDERG